MADKDEKKKGGGKAWIGALALCTLVAIGTGGGLGMYLMSSVEKAVDQKTREAQEHEKAAKVLNYSGDLTLRSVGSVVTNLAEPADSWIRLESSVVFKTGSLPTPDITVAEIKADMHVLHFLVMHAAATLNTAHVGQDGRTRTDGRHGRKS